MRKLTAFITVALFTKAGLAQGTSNDTATYGQAVQAAISSYFLSINNGAALYNGVEHASYFGNFEGIAYYKVDNWQNATIAYDGVVYNNVPAKYDLVKDQVIVKHPTGIGFCLFSPRVSYFVIGGDHFINLPGGAAMPATGFYQQLRSGKLSVLAKRKKVIEELIEQQELKKRFETTDQYYVIKEGIYHNPRNRSSLLALVGDHRSEAKRALKKSGIHFRKNPEEAILTVVNNDNQ